jgi:hypothetical protein
MVCVTARYLSVTARYLSVTARYLSVTAGGKEGTRLRRDVEKLSVTSHQLCGICAKEVKKLNKKINNTKKNEIK